MIKESTPYNIYFKRKTDRTEIPFCNIFGVNIAAVNMGKLCDFVCKNIKNLSGDYICVSNVHTVVTASEDENYMRVQNGGILAVPDGGPLASVGRKRGFSDMQRTTGQDFMEEILKISAEKGFSHYFYGSTEETLKKMRDNLEKNYQGIEIKGMYSPPFRTLTEEESDNITQMINEANADFVWVGLGAPKQEIWMAEHQGKINGLMVGIGAAFDYQAGNIDRAPKWMQKCNLEWAYRLMQDPKRLFKRYFHTNPKFIWNVIIRGR